MAEGNGEIIEEMATTNKTDGNGEPERTVDYPKLVEYGLDKRVNYIDSTPYPPPVFSHIVFFFNFNLVCVRLHFISFRVD